MPDYSIIAKLLRYYILLATTTAGSGHVTSSLSAADLLTVVYFNYLRYDFNKHNLANDRLIFSKGHATPLLYALYKVAGQITKDELLQYRKINSSLQGHPTPDTPYIDVATGSLGMGLSYGLGMALGLKRNQELSSNLPKIYVLLGDGEMAEGQNYEALQLASHYHASNLIGLLDVNRLAETGETQLGYDLETYQKRIASFGWETIVLDGHNFDQIDQTLNRLSDNQNKPTMIIAKTAKGKGVSFLENQPNKHGKALQQAEFEKAVSELQLGNLDLLQTYPVKQPAHVVVSMNSNHSQTSKIANDHVSNSTEPMPTRKAYGQALLEMSQMHAELLVLDADLSDSTFSSAVEKDNPSQFLNMFIAEQNMVSVAVGLSKVGYKPFISTFSAFLTRAYDQIRMASLSQANMVLTGSHGGVSVGEDGPSGMGLEDIAMLRPILDLAILYPADANSMVKLVDLAYHHPQITYLRSTRVPTHNIYPENEQFVIGGSKTLTSSTSDQCAIFAAGITLHEALNAAKELASRGVSVRVIDLYSIKPIDAVTIIEAAKECQNRLITVEDHSVHGGLGDAVMEVFTNQPLPRIIKLGVHQRPHSGTPAQNLAIQGIDASSICNAVSKLVGLTI